MNERIDNAATNGYATPGGPGGGSVTERSRSDRKQDAPTGYPPSVSFGVLPSPSVSFGVFPSLSVTPASSCDGSIDVSRFLPREGLTWKRALFNLARGTWGRQDADAVFAEWCRRAAAELDPQDVAEEWACCKVTVKHPHRIQLDAILRESASKGIAAWIAQAIPESARFQAVIAFLWELQQQVFPQDFFWMTAKDLGLLFEKDRQWAWRALKLFCRKGVLEIVEQGGPHKATRYRFVERIERPEFLNDSS